MTIRTKRRGRRSLAAILAAMLMASVLAVVAGSPVQAANTSGEYLVDTNEDGAPDAREFAGRDRYDTSLRLAKRFADSRGGIGSVPNAFIASGESLVDAVSVSGLAGFMDAPVLLTPSSNLHGAVADFIEDYGISNIYVLGGTVAVSDGVVDALKALANSPSVERIQGDSRFDTSAAIASKLAGESWCGTNDNSAIVVNGSNDSLFDAIAIGPVANRLELPVLLTAGDELVDAVLSYLETEDVEHVVVVGGEGSVSNAVMDALSDAGVDTVERIGGDSAAATSVAIAEVIGDACADDLSPVSGDTVALVNRNSLSDGISAAPVLADDNDQLGGGLIPILAVGDTLPASVRDYLAATPEEDAAGNKIHLRILAIGGTVAVSDSVMAAAVSAAASADALTVTISASDTMADAGLADARGTNTIHLHFSDDITRVALADLRNRLEDILQVNGVPADIATDRPEEDADAPCDPDTVPVTLERTLKAGDVVSIVSGTVLVGASGDRRTVQPADATVPAAPVDRQRPTIRIVAIIGHNAVYGLVSDNTALAADGLLAATPPTGSDLSDLFEVTAGDVGVLTVASNATFPEADSDDPAPKSSLLTFTLGNVEDTAATEVGVIDSSDRFRANRGAVEDAAGNESQVTTGVPVRPVSKLQVSSVLMSNLAHTAQAITVIPSAHELDAAPADDVLRSVAQAQANASVWLQAKADGAAAGAFGNGWTVRADRASTWNGDKDADIDVFVNTTDRRIVVRIANGKPKYADLKAALEANSTVNSLFNVLVDNAYDADDEDTCKAANLELKHGALPVLGDTEGDPDADDIAMLTSGITKANIKVNFNGWVEDIGADDQSGRLLGHILADTMKRHQPGVAAPVLATTLTALGPVVATVLTHANADGPVRDVSFGISTSEASALPLPRDIVDVPDGFDKDTAGKAVDGTVDVAGEAATQGVQRTDTGGNSVANGYGDNGADDVDNDHNYGSKSRITRSTSVAAPTE